MHVNAAARLCLRLLLTIRTASYPVPAMVSILGHYYGRWVARLRALATRLLVLHDMGYYLGELSVLLRVYCRAVREVSPLRERWMYMRALSFNINAFSSRESLSLLRFPPHHVGQLSVLLQVDVPFSYPQYAVSPIECLCIVFRRLASPAPWTDLEQLLGGSRSALCNIILTNLEVIMSKWGYLLTEWRGCLMHERPSVYAQRV